MRDWLTCVESCVTLFTFTYNLIKILLGSTYDFPPFEEINVMKQQLSEAIYL